jgi:hypothetical protein
MYITFKNFGGNNLTMKKAIQLLSIIALFGIIGFFYQSSTKVDASVGLANEYHSRVLTSANKSATVPLVIASSTQALGSVVITNAGAGVIRFYDGIASTTAPQTATSTGTLLAQFKASTVEGTYTFDVVTSNGLIADIPADFAGIMTITYR